MMNYHCKANKKFKYMDPNLQCFTAYTIYPQPMRVQGQIPGNDELAPRPRRVLLSTPDSQIMPPLLEPPLRPVQIPHARVVPHYSLGQPGFIGPNFYYAREPSLSLIGGRAVNTSTPVFMVRKSIQTMEYEKVLADHTITINPKKVQFIPANAWQNENIAFGVLVATFFRKRNSMHCKFPNKIFNALKLSVFMPEFIPHIGVEWVTETVFRVNRVAFARLLGVKAIEGGLFHQQGNFPSHGFYELPFAESDQLSRMYGYGPADLSQVRFMTHSSGMFRRSSTEMDIEKCRWNGKQ